MHPDHEIDLKSRIEEASGQVGKSCIMSSVGRHMAAATTVDNTNTSTSTSNSTITYLKLHSEYISTDSLEYIMNQLDELKVLEIIIPDPPLGTEQDEEAYEALFAQFETHCTSGRLRYTQVIMSHRYCVPDDNQAPDAFVEL